MTVQEIIQTVTESAPGDWNVVPTRSSAGSSPGGCCQCEVGQEGASSFAPGHHTMAAVYLPEPLIRLEWGQTFNDGFEEPWTNRFADRRAVGQYVDICYAGAPVYQDAFVVVDGGRALLPMPNVETLTVAPGQKRFMRLVDALGCAYGRFDSCLRKAGITEGDDPWPVFGREH